MRKYVKIFISYGAVVANWRPAGRIRPAEPKNLARRIIREICFQYRILEFSNFLQDLINEFSSRFADISKIDELLGVVNTPFGLEPNGNWVNQAKLIFSDIEKATLQVEIIEFQESEVLKQAFRENTTESFWAVTVPSQSYPILKKIAIFLCSIFGSTYICESSFS